MLVGLTSRNYYFSLVFVKFLLILPFCLAKYLEILFELIYYTDSFKKSIFLIAYSFKNMILIWHLDYFYSKLIFLWDFHVKYN